MLENQLPRTIHTARLILRPPRLDDAQAVFDAYAHDPEVTRFLTWRPHSSVAETNVVLERIVEADQQGKAVPWTITDRVTQRLLGMINLRLNDFKPDVGYVLARHAWGQGYMPEALRAVIDAAWTVPTIFRVWAVCDIDNPQSARVMEKAGMVFEGTLRRWTIHPNVGSEPRDVLCYAATR